MILRGDIPESTKPPVRKGLIGFTDETFKIDFIIIFFFLQLNILIEKLLDIILIGGGAAAAAAAAGLYVYLGVLKT